MDVDTLKDIFRASFDPDFITKLGRETGAFRRIRDITPYNLLFALLIDCFRGHSRSIVGARREYEHLAGPVAVSTFDGRLDSAGCVRWIWRLVAHLRHTRNRVTRRAWPAALRVLTEVLREDSSTCRVAKGAPFESTQRGQAAIKVMTTLSLATGVVRDGRLAAAVHHDRPLLRGDIVAGALYLRDLGGYDHAEFARVEDGGARFVSRLKRTAIPVVKAVFDGLTPDHVGAAMTDDLPYGPTVDVEAWFDVASARRVFRVVMIPLPAKDAKGRRLPGQTMQGWFVTNLARTEWDAMMVSLAYRLRWAVERLFRRGKQFCGLGALRSERPTIVAVFVGISLVAMTLGAAVTAALRAAAVRGTISDDVPHLILRTWSVDIARLLRHPGPAADAIGVRLRNALVYDARHRNTRQPLALDAICDEIERRTNARVKALSA